MSADPQKAVNWLAYGTAWIKYAGALLTALGSVGDIVRDNISHLKKPDVNEFYK